MKNFFSVKNHQKTFLLSRFFPARWFGGFSSKSSKMLGNAMKNREGKNVFWRFFTEKNDFRQKIYFFAIRIVYMFMHTKYHGGTTKTCSGKKLHKIYHFYVLILWILLVLDTDWTDSLRAGDRKSSKIPDFPIC